MSRPELATIDGMPPPADLPRGECVCTRLPDGSIRIDHADPLVLISAELLVGIAAKPSRNAWLDGSHAQAGYIGALLKISAVNRTVIYRITEYVAAVHGYIGQWPD